VNNTDLEKALQKAKVPEPRPGFWDELPGNVQRAIDRGEAADRRKEAVAAPGIFELLLRKAAVPLAFAVICVMIGFRWGANSRKPEVQPSELAEARACWREVAALFPNQLEAIVFDQQGSSVVLSDKANQPSSPPIYLKLCDDTGCKRFITFSGQQIKVNGESFEVLVGRDGEVLLVGDAKVWNSSNRASNLGGYKVVAIPLANS
jgi:hypothetical protein